MGKGLYEGRFKGINYETGLFVEGRRFHGTESELYNYPPLRLSDCKISEFIITDDDVVFYIDDPKTIEMIETDKPVSEITALREENRILREGLGRYADEGNWGCPGCPQARDPFDHACDNSMFNGSEFGFDLAIETLAAADAVGEGKNDA